MGKLNTVELYFDLVSHIVRDNSFKSLIRIQFFIFLPVTTFNGYVQMNF